MANLMLSLSLLAITWSSLALAHEPSPLQDFCVADFNAPVRVNGFACLDPKQVTSDHFLFRGLNIPGNTSNPLGAFINRPTVLQIPGLNTLGISTVRVDYRPGGVVPPHRHPRASEILTQNVGQGNAVTIAFLSSQNPGVIAIANSVFGSDPPIDADVLAKAFQVEKSIINKMQAAYN
ncbi:UNVERIFIED_CONTAM: putative germin-like protein 2-2 [Sesamum angustifolium]|uniref:Germin-like protein 2-2 n=1 Tax=Sesamum angustifolium TaxID=2727405 RepID=A0AAW2PDI2_9LAMI